MESGKLKLTLHSAKGLRDVKHLGTMNPYAIIQIDGDCPPCIHKTNTAKKAGPNPQWEFPMTFNNVSSNHNHTLVIQIEHDGTVFDRKIGYVKIPVADLLAGDASAEKVRYKVKISSGKEKGEVILSHKFSVSGEGDESGTGTSTSTGDGDNHNAGVYKKDRRVKTIVKKVGAKIVAGAVVVGVEMGINEISD